MAKTCIIGVGSPFGADRLGWLAIEALRQREIAQDVELLQCRQPVELSSMMQGYDSVVLLDAMIGGHPLGTVVPCAWVDIPNAGLGVSSHGFGVGDALQLAQALGHLPRYLCVLGMEVGSAEQAIAPDWVTRLADAALDALS